MATPGVSVGHACRTTTTDNAVGDGLVPSRAVRTEAVSRRERGRGQASPTGPSSPAGASRKTLLNCADGAASRTPARLASTRARLVGTRAVQERFAAPSEKLGSSVQLGARQERWLAAMVLPLPFACGYFPPKQWTLGSPTRKRPVSVCPKRHSSSKDRKRLRSAQAVQVRMRELVTIAPQAAIAAGVATTRTTNPLAGKIDDARQHIGVLHLRHQSRAAWHRVVTTRSPDCGSHRLR